MPRLAAPLPCLLRGGALLLTGRLGGIRRRSLLQEASECCAARVTVYGVGRLLELDPVEQALDVTGDRVSGHDERCIERVRGRCERALVVGHGSALRIFLEQLTGERLIALANLEYREVVHDGERFVLG